MAIWPEWTENEKELMRTRARQLRKRDPAIKWKDLYIKAQQPLPIDRRFQGGGDVDVHGWLLIASYHHTFEGMSAKIDEIWKLVQDIQDRLNAEFGHLPRAGPIPLMDEETARKVAEEEFEELNIRLADDARFEGLRLGRS